MKLWDVILMSTVWIVLKAYGVDEDDYEMGFLSVNYISSFLKYRTNPRNQILDYEHLILKYTNYNIYGPELKQLK